MSNRRYNITAPREGSDGKTYWTVLGVGFATKSGDGVNCILNAYPVPNKDGEVRFYLFPADKKDNSESSGGSKPAEQPADDLDDDIPF